VIGYDVNVDEEKPGLSTFHVSISTVFSLKFILIGVTLELKRMKI
jgi:hypothetical protein